MNNEHLRVLPENVCGTEEQERRRDNDLDPLPKPQLTYVNCEFSCFEQLSLDKHLASGDLSCLKAENEQRLFLGQP